MHQLRLIFNAINYTGYICWSFSIYSFLGELFTHTFSIENVNSFLSALATLVAVAFAMAKLVIYWRDSKVKSKILEEELKAKQNENFYKKWNGEFINNKNNDQT